MTSAPGPLARALNLRRGEARILAVLAGYLFLSTATITAISASKNGLFLSVYPGRLLPWAVVAAALVTATVAVVFTGLIAGTARRLFAVGVTTFLALTLGLSQVAFRIDEGTTFALYLWISTVQILVMTQAWDYVSDLLTGRQAKRLMPLIGIGASLGSLLGGISVAPLALGLGTANLLWVGAGLQVATLPLLWALPAPDAGAGLAPRESKGAVADFLDGASHGFRSIARQPLLQVMAGTIIFLSLTSTLVELQYKLALQASFTEDEIAAVYGIMIAVTGACTLLLQVVASRVIFPRLGVSAAALLQAGGLFVGACAAVIFGGFAARAALEVLDETLENALEKPVEQISLLPFPGPVKTATVATLGGVLRPLSIAVGGGIAILLASRANLLAVATAVCAAGAVAVVLRHRPLYLKALEEALAGHRVDLSTMADAPLLADREALSVVDRGLADEDPMVVVFSASLLAQLPAGDALPRAAELLEHPVPEVRAEAVRILGGLDVAEDRRVRALLEGVLGREEAGFVLAATLDALGAMGELDPERVQPFLGHAEEPVRRRALVALGRAGEPGVEERILDLLDSDRGSDQRVAAGAAGDLGYESALPRLRRLVETGQARPAALEAMASLGDSAVPVLAEILDERALPLPLRRGVVTTLASVPRPLARDTLLSLVEEPALGPAALTSLRRLRTEGTLGPVPAEALLPHLEREVRRGYRYGLVSTAVAERGLPEAAPDGYVTPSGDALGFLVREMDGLRLRSIYRTVQVLSLSYDPDVLDSVQRALSSGDAGQASNALELLEGMLGKTEAALVLPFAEAGLDGVDVEEARRLLGDEADALHDDPFGALLDDADWWPRAMALHALGRAHEIAMPGRDPDDHDEGDTMIPLIERVMILKGSELFRYFPGSDLAGIASLADVVHVEAGEDIFHQGDEGDAFYMVVRGTVAISRGSTELAALGPREGFGEMALLDRETRSATATASEPTTLLKLDRDSFDRLIEQNPSVARGIYRMLTQRLRNTLAQVAAG